MAAVTMRGVLEVPAKDNEPIDPQSLGSFVGHTIDGYLITAVHVRRSPGRPDVVRFSIEHTVDIVGILS